MFGKKKDDLKMETGSARDDRAGTAGQAKPEDAGKRAASKGLSAPMDQRKKLSVLTGACVAVTIGAVGFSAIQYSQASDLMYQIQGSTAKVLVATEDLPAGTELTAENTETALVSTKYLPNDVAKSEDDVVGLRVLTNVTAGLPIDLAGVSGSEAPSNVAGAIREGYVAKMVSLDTAAGLAPLLAPGDHVTVSGVEGNTGEVITYKGIRVIALDDAFTGAAGNAYSTVTLELTQDQADSLSLLSVSLTAEPAVSHLPETAAKAADGAAEKDTAPVEAKGKTTKDAGKQSDEVAEEGNADA